MQATAAVQLPSVTPITSLPQKAGGWVGKCLIFNLGVEEFGTQVLKIREIMGLQEITTVPMVPDYVKGVINLRGKVIPVVDLRIKFGLPPVEYTSRTCIIVVRTQQGGTDVLMGMVVDGVVEVLSLTAEDIQDTPDFGTGVSLPYLNGMAKIKGRVKILLDIDKVLNSQELSGLNALVQ